MKHLIYSQLCSIQSIVRVVEEKLRDMETVVYFTLQHCEKGIQVTLKHDLTSHELMDFQHKVIEIKKTLRQIAETYGFAHKQVSLKRVIGAKAAFMWQDIPEADFDRLKGHGEVDEGLRGNMKRSLTLLPN